MTKYHIKNDGTPGVCRATKAACPLGGADSHFDTAEAAAAEGQARLERAAKTATRSDAVTVAMNRNLNNRPYEDLLVEGTIDEDTYFEMIDSVDKDGYPDFKVREQALAYEAIDFMKRNEDFVGDLPAGNYTVYVDSEFDISGELRMTTVEGNEMYDQDSGIKYIVIPTEYEGYMSSAEEDCESGHKLMEVTK